MGKRSVVPVIAVVLLLLVALASSAAAAQERPFKLSWTGTFEVEPGATTCLGPTPVYTEGTGTATHLGRMTIVEQDCVDFTAEPLPVFTDGIITFTAANGDELWGTFAGEVTAPPDADGWMSIRTVMEYDGGTGRFADATGNAIEVGRVLPTSDTGGLIEGEIEGVVTY